MTLRQLQQASFSPDFEKGVMASISEIVTVSGTILSFTKWTVAASLLLVSLSTVFHSQSGSSDTTSYLENQYSYATYEALGDLYE